MNSVKIDIDDCLMKAILVMPIAMLLQRKIDFVNKVLVGVILVLLILSCIRKGKVHLRSFLAITGSMIVFAYSLFNINKLYFTVNMLFYFPLWVLYLRYVTDNYENFFRSFERNRRLSAAVIWIWCFLVIVSSFFSSSYLEGQFQSFADGNFRFAPTVFFMGTLIWSYARLSGNRTYMLLLLIPLVAMVETASRTYTIIFLLLVGLAFYSYFNKKRYFVLMVIPVIILTVFLLSGSEFTQKFAAATQNQYVSDPMAALTSNRSVFWAGEIRLFLKAGLLEKLFGGGLTSSFVKNVSISGQAIWAHNDFLELLNAHGMVGLSIYVSMFLEAFSSLKRRFNYNLLQGSVFILTCSLNAFFNGLYVYTTAMLAIPFLAFAVSADFSKELNRGRNDQISKIIDS